MMRFSFVALALLPLALTACQSYDIQQVRDETVQLLKKQYPAQTLTQYTWHLDTGAQRDMVVTLAPEGRLSVQTTCNSIRSTWRDENNTLITGHSMMTQMACNQSNMRQEMLATQLLDQRAVPFVLDTSNPKQPTLTLMDATGQRYVFTGKITPEALYQGEAETLFYEIHPQTKTCTGIVNQQCLQVKEIRYNQQGLKTYQDANWSLFYDTIQGFEHHPNERQVIRVKRYTIKNPAADQSKYAYVHDLTVERGRID